MPYKTVKRTTPCGGTYTERVFVPERKRTTTRPSPAKVVEREIKRIKKERKKEATETEKVPV